MDTNGILVLVAPLECAVQMYSPAVYRPVVFRLHHFSTSAVHSRGRRAYDTMRTQQYWPHMVIEVLGTVRNCESCAHNWKIRNRKRKVGFFPASGSVKFTAVAILGLFPNVNSSHQYIVVMTYCFSKFNEGTTDTKKYCNNGSHYLLGTLSWELWHTNESSNEDRTASYVPVFRSYTTPSGVKAITTTEHHPQTNVPVECFNRKIVYRLGHYMAEY